jgi:hypothetical protein
VVTLLAASLFSRALWLTLLGAEVSDDGDFQMRLLSRGAVLLQLAAGKVVRR